MSQKQVKFSIVHIDPLAQGVSKMTNKVNFVSNTLAGETGTCLTYKENKKVMFSFLKSSKDLDNISKDRIDPLCPHYFQCGGCSYLHTNYETEMNLKKDALLWNFKNIKIPEVSIIKSEERFNYRNRIQLHFNNKENSFGYKGYDNNIINIDNCIIASKNIQNKINDAKEIIYSEGGGKGHLELFEKNNKVELNINSKYSAGGFTQVNPKMNIKLKNYIKNYFKNISTSTIIDLFGGNGNISEIFEYNQRTVIDIFENKQQSDENSSFVNMNLYNEDNLKNLVAKYASISTDLLFIDPPRSGFKELNILLNEISPSYFVYISCNNSTMARDLSQLPTNFQISQYLIFFQEHITLKLLS